MKEIVNNSEDSDFSDDSNQSHDRDMSPANLNRPIYSENAPLWWRDRKQNMEKIFASVSFFWEAGIKYKISETY